MKRKEIEKALKHVDINNVAEFNVLYRLRTLLELDEIINYHFKEEIIENEFKDFINNEVEYNSMLGLWERYSNGKRLQVITNLLSNTQDDLLDMRERCIQSGWKVFSLDDAEMSKLRDILDKDLGNEQTGIDALS